MPSIMKQARHAFDVAANPFFNTTPLQPYFSMKYGLHQFIDLTSRAEKIRNPYVGTIAKLGAHLIDLIGALFYLPVAFAFNWTIGSLRNRYIHINNSEIRRDSKNWRLKNNTPLYIVAAGLVGALAYYGYIGCVRDSAKFAQFRSWLSSMTPDFLSANKA